MDTGRVTLLDGAGDTLHSILYRDRWHRDVIVSGWWSMYGKGMVGCLIQYCPDTDDERIDAHGGNIRRVRLPLITTIETPKSLTNGSGH